MFIHQTLNGVHNTGHSINVQSYKDLRHSISSSSTVPTSLSACLGPRVFHEESIYIIIINRVERNVRPYLSGVSISLHNVIHSIPLRERLSRQPILISYRPPRPENVQPMAVRAEARQRGETRCSEVWYIPNRLRDAEDGYVEVAVKHQQLEEYSMTIVSGLSSISRLRGVS